MKGRRIRRMERLVELANEGRACWVEAWHRPSPASWMVSMQLRVVSQFMNIGIFEYKEKNGNASSSTAKPDPRTQR